MLNILAFADYFGVATSGGAEVVAARVYRRLADDGDVRLTVVASVPGTGDPVEGEVDGIRLVRVPGRDLSAMAGGQLLVSSRLWPVARSLVAERPDVIHGNGLHFAGTAIGATLARRHRIPFVATAHLAGLSALRGRQRLAGTVWDHTIGRRIVATAASLVAVSDSVAIHLRSLGAHERTVTVVPNGVDHDLFRPVPAHGLGGPLEVVFVGRLIANKGPLLTLDAMRRLRREGVDANLRIVGDGPLRPVLERRAASLDGHVKFVGHSRDVASHLRAAHVLVRPSFTEGLPLAVLEAMACGVPVVCSDVAGNLEVVRHECNGLVFPAGDAQALATCLARLARDRGLLAALGRQAHLDAVDYTWERSARGHLAAFRSVAGGGDALARPSIPPEERHARSFDSEVEIVRGSAS